MCLRPSLDNQALETNRDAGLGLLGDPTRRAIFELLARRPCSVGGLAEQLPISRPAVSQHLRVLCDGGLVVSRAEGTRRVYRLDPDEVAALQAWLDRIWEEASTSLPSAAGGHGAGAFGDEASPQRPAEQHDREQAEDRLRRGPEVHGAMTWAPNRLAALPPAPRRGRPCRFPCVARMCRHPGTPTL